VVHLVDGQLVASPSAEEEDCTIWVELPDQPDEWEGVLGSDSRRDLGARDRGGAEPGYLHGREAAGELSYETGRRTQRDANVERVEVRDGTLACSRSAWWEDRAPSGTISEPA